MHAVPRIAMLLASFGLISSPAFARPARPEPLVGQADCESYQGTPVGANDSTQLFELRVCPSATGVSATEQSSSLVSGHSMRASTGSWDASGKTLTLVENEFLDNRPEPGWRFCLIDELVLTRTATGLEGTYVSTDCNDRATLKLDRIEPGVPAAAATVTPTPPAATPPAAIPPPPPPEPPAASVEAPSSGCTCTSDDRQTNPVPMLLLLGLLVARVRRRGGVDRVR